jgi:hypothetical protein
MPEVHLDHNFMFLNGLHWCEAAVPARRSCVDLPEIVNWLAIAGPSSPNL